VRYLNRHRPLLAIATILILVTSCASSEGDEQLDEPMLEEVDQEEAAEQIEQLPQEETAPSNVTDALASELDHWRPLRRHPATTPCQLVSWALRLLLYSRP